MSKLLTIPHFKAVPKSSVANVQENIDLWIKKGDVDSLNDFTIVDNDGKRRFKFADDLTETIVQQNQFIPYYTSNKRGITVDVVWKRRYIAKDHLCPLYFSESSTVIYILYYNYCFVYESDAQLKRFCRAICDKKYFIISNNHLMF